MGLEKQISGMDTNVYEVFNQQLWTFTCTLSLSHLSWSRRICLTPALCDQNGLVGQPRMLPYAYDGAYLLRHTTSGLSHVCFQSKQPVIHDIVPFPTDLEYTNNAMSVVEEVDLSKFACMTMGMQSRNGRRYICTYTL